MASVKIDITEDTLLVGIAASPGIAISKSRLVNRSQLGAIERRISDSEVEAELAAFRAAVECSRQQLIQIKQQAKDKVLAEHLYIIDTHLLILDDDMLIGESEALIAGEKINAEGAFNRTLRKLRRAFDNISDEYIRERRSDIDSIGDRVMRNLLGEIRETFDNLDSQVIVVAHDLSPGDTVQMDKEKVVGFVTDVGGRTSHTAILARSLGIPAVVGLETVTSIVPDDLPMIIDGTNGTVILKPSAETFRKYLEKKQRYEYLEKELEAFRQLPAETLDGYRLVLRGNVDFADEVENARLLGAEGIGLFRTEFLFMTGEDPPSEEEQFNIYRRAVELMAPYPVTIRTLDVGGEKFVPEFNLSDEANPVMGLRAIRFSLKEVNLFRTQLRAILRASAFGQIRIMFPMISGVAEMRSCKQFLDKARQELANEGVAVAENVDVGVMIETPAAVLVSDLLAKEVDFFSVGTNDLIQYCLAIDRSNEHVAYLYEPMHPAVLRALRLICDAAKTEGIEVGMCGEMAGEQLYSLVLIALGFNELSMNPVNISRIKRVMRQVDMGEVKGLLEKMLTLSTATDVATCLESEMAEKFPEVFNLELL
ncbi:MAG: phosphoenolpyruvate--protein phosphotransferase [Deltaproteobacteria bacterium]|jgi:phosphotransferase system enzyme I (PtsI)|nr:phosphoenolpyruvate--protein phosphotransferase [Deltaproteobacteria bacterium]MBW2520772.1 phosphoenolpyruvate--protein phosphotransferase [Deltaproteobacteria bacterium]